MDTSADDKREITHMNILLAILLNKKYEHWEQVNNILLDHELVWSHYLLYIYFSLKSALYFFLSNC